MVTAVTELMYHISQYTITISLNFVFVFFFLLIYFGEWDKNWDMYFFLAFRDGVVYDIEIFFEISLLKTLAQFRS